jgi:hypothetical protein
LERSKITAFAPPPRGFIAGSAGTSAAIGITFAPSFVARPAE